MTQMKQFYINDVQHFHAVVSFEFSNFRVTMKTEILSLPSMVSGSSGSSSRATM